MLSEEVVSSRQERSEVLGLLLNWKYLRCGHSDSLVVTGQRDLFEGEGVGEVSFIVVVG